MHQPLTIWTNVHLADDVRQLLKDATAGHVLISPDVAQRSNLVAGAPDPGFERADVAFGQPHPDDVFASTKLKWVHLSSAGYTRYDTAPLRQHAAARGIAFTNSSQVYNEPCAQHVLAMMLGFARQLPAAVVDQNNGSTWPYLPLRQKSFLLNGQTALIVGYGAIGRMLAELLAPFQMNVIGFRRTPSTAEPVPVVSISELDQHLGRADHVINILPAAAGTDGFFGVERLAKLKPGARFYNIGRGTTVDQPALQTALTTGHLAAAFLDVTDPEPLPKNHPLWTAPNLYITPHTAGGHANEFERQVAHFSTNLERFSCGEKLVDRIF